MKHSKKLICFTLLWLGLSGRFLVPDAQGYWFYYDLALLQLDGDSYPDVCVLSDDVVIKGNAFGPTSDTYFYLTTSMNANGAFRDPSDVLLGKDSPKYVTEAYLSTGDLNNDGYTDAVATTVNRDSVILLLQKADSSGTFDLPMAAAIGASPKKTAIGDLNADGFNDIAVSGADDHLIILFNEPSNPGHAFTPASLNYGSVHVDIGDLNADLRNDMVLAGTENIVVLFQDSLIPGDFVETLDLTAGERPSCVQIVDMDNDGFKDIAAGFRGTEGTHDTGSIAIFYQDPTRPGLFLSPVTYGLSCEALGMDVGDLNSDGLLDIAVAARCAGEGVVALFFQDNDATRTFSLSSRLSCEEVPFALKIADLGQDGRNDIVVSDWDVVGFYQSESIPGDFPERAVILKSELSNAGSGDNGGSGGAEGGGCFISTVVR